MQFKIAELSSKKAHNGNTAEVLTLTRITEDRETVRLFKNLYMKFRAIKAIFDPLGIFHDVPDPEAGIRIEKLSCGLSFQRYFEDGKKYL